MSDADIFIGHHCPNCGTTIGVVVGVGGGTQRCPGCGGPMQAGKGGPGVQVLTNVTCKGCGSQYGMITAIGGKATCGSCGGPLP
jgi:hypothetical protein